jgi:hypothetical protein
MANKAKGERKLTIGNTEYTLFYDMNALAELEDVTGMTIPEVGNLMADASKISIKFMRAFLYAGLQFYHSDEIQTVKDAGRLMTQADDLNDVFATAVEAFSSVFAKDEKSSQKKINP